MTSQICKKKLLSHEQKNPFNVCASDKRQYTVLSLCQILTLDMSE